MMMQSCHARDAPMQLPGVVQLPEGRHSKVSLPKRSWAYAHVKVHALPTASKSEQDWSTELRGKGAGHVHTACVISQEITAFVFARTC